MIKNRYALLKSYINKKSGSCGLPRVIGVEVTNRCNLNCIMCARREMVREVGDMEFELFKKIIDQGRGYLEFIWLQNLGEPFLHKDIFKMVEYCRKKGLRTGISSNGTVMNEEIIRGIIASGLDYLIIGFDGASKQTFEKIRCGASFDKVVHNIKNLIQYKLQNKSRLFLVIQCIYMAQTQKEIAGFKRLWGVKGVDGLRIRQITYSGDKAGERYINRKSAWPCYWPWSNPHILWDGTLVPCCQDINAEYNIGNLHQHSLSELWNSQKMREIRRLLIKKEYASLPLCRRCNMFQPNLMEVAGSAFLGQFTLNKLIPRIESFICAMKYGRKKE